MQAGAVPSLPLEQPGGDHSVLDVVTTNAQPGKMEKAQNTPAAQAATIAPPEKLSAPLATAQQAEPLSENLSNLASEGIAEGSPAQLRPEEQFSGEDKEHPQAEGNKTLPSEPGQRDSDSPSPKFDVLQPPTELKALKRTSSPRPEREGGKPNISGEAGPSGRCSVDEGVGIAAGRRSVAIRPKDWAGIVVWAKLAKYPWWPAQVLDESDPWIPSDSEPPRRGAIPVRFFGTYDFAWIESQRAICPYDQNHEEYSSKSKQKSFTDALAEADHFRKTQELPEGFNEDSTPSPQKAQKKGKAGASRAKGKRGEPWNRKGAKRGADGNPASKQRSARERQDSVLQNLALVPPADSPFSHSVCLNGVRKLMEMAAAGQYPPPQPYAAQPAYMPAQMPGQGGFPSAQLQQQQHFQQQMAVAAGQGRPQWPAHLQAYNPQNPLQSFFQSQSGGVQGALLAAASQAQFPPKQF